MDKSLIHVKKKKPVLSISEVQQLPSNGAEFNLCKKDENSSRVFLIRTLYM